MRERSSEYGFLSFVTPPAPHASTVSVSSIVKILYAHSVPGFAQPRKRLLYSPELKFYSNKVKMDTDLETNIAGLHCLGDSSGWTVA